MSPSQTKGNLLALKAERVLARKHYLTSADEMQQLIKTGLDWLALPTAAQGKFISRCTPEDAPKSFKKSRMDVCYINAERHSR